MSAIAELAQTSTQARLGSRLLAPAMADLQEEIDPETPGGAYMLGLRQLGVIAHGRFTRRGFAHAIEVAARGVREDVIASTRTALEKAGALRKPARVAQAQLSSEHAATFS
jgi:glycerol-3-phosphate acyltransferase PlsX